MNNKNQDEIHIRYDLQLTMLGTMHGGVTMVCMSHERHGR